MRSRQMSSPIFRLSMYTQIPANDEVGIHRSPRSPAGSRGEAQNRFSVASASSLVSSCSSLPEEGEEGIISSPPAPARQRRASKRSSLPLNHVEAVQGKRLSMASVLSSTSATSSSGTRQNGMSRSSSKGRASPLSRTTSLVDTSSFGKENGSSDESLLWTEEERAERVKKSERRLRLAEELRDTERAYAGVLDEIDTVSCARLGSPTLAASR